MTNILEYVNELAVNAGFKFAIAPVTNWKRPTFTKSIGDLTFTLVGGLLVPEAFVINEIRRPYQQAALQKKKEIQKILVSLASLLGVDTYEELTDVLSDPLKLAEVVRERDIAQSTIDGWTSKLSEANSSIDLKALQDTNQLLSLVSFFIVMRADPDWTFEDSFQLETEVMDEILALLLAEESKETPALYQANEEETNLKKNTSD